MAVVYLEAVVFFVPSYLGIGMLQCTAIEVSWRVVAAHLLPSGTSTVGFGLVGEFNVVGHKA